jgi:hypothetical protein
MPFKNMDALDIDRINLGLRILARGLPQWYQHFCSVFLVAVFDPTEHAGTPCIIAHTWSPKHGGRAIVFRKKPSTFSPVDMAETLRHEADHHRPGFGGTSPNFHEMENGRVDTYRDPIYLRDRELRSRLEVAWWQIAAKSVPKPAFNTGAAPTLGKVVGAAAVVALCVFGLAALGKAIKR